MNHLHMIISYPPTLSISSIVRKLKQESTNKIWQLYEKDLQNEFWKEHTFWSDGYFVCSIGNASINTVKNILNSKEINPVQSISETKDFRVFLQIYYKNLIYLLTNKKFYDII